MYPYQRNHGVNQRDVLVFQTLHVPDDPGLGVVHVEDRVGQVRGGALQLRLSNVVLLHVAVLKYLEGK